MTSVITMTSESGAGEAEPVTAPLPLNTLTPGFGCVYLSSSIRDAECVTTLLRSARIRIYHASRLEDAKAQLKLTDSRVLLTDRIFQGGTWEDALQMTIRLRPSTALVVTARLADERLWLSVLQRGAYDLIPKPFQADELRRILENAHDSSIMGRSLYLTA
jgi:DNA-binding NtrC family response regulator